MEANVSQGKTLNCRWTQGPPHVIISWIAVNPFKYKSTP